MHFLESRISAASSRTACNSLQTGYSTYGIRLRNVYSSPLSAASIHLCNFGQEPLKARCEPQSTNDFDSNNNDVDADTSIPSRRGGTYRIDITDIVRKF